MNNLKTEKDDIILIAKKTKHYCDLLIAQSDDWTEGKDFEKTPLTHQTFTEEKLDE